MTSNRVIDLEEEMVMVVTDLHGDGDAYARYRDRFLRLQAQGQADYLILTGDLLHRTPPAPDESLVMILDVIRLKAELGERFIYLMGNCEGGYTLVNKQQLRIASAKHAHPRESGHYLLFDVGEKIKSAETLLPKLSRVFT